MWKCSVPSNEEYKCSRLRWRLRITNMKLRRSGKRQVRVYLSQFKNTKHD